MMSSILVFDWWVVTVRHTFGRRGHIASGRQVQCQLYSVKYYKHMMNYHHRHIEQVSELYRSCSSNCWQPLKIGLSKEMIHFTSLLLMAIFWNHISCKALGPLLLQFWQHVNKRNITVQYNWNIDRVVQIVFAMTDFASSVTCMNSGQRIGQNSFLDTTIHRLCCVTCDVHVCAVEKFILRYKM